MRRHLMIFMFAIMALTSTLPFSAAQENAKVRSIVILIHGVNSPNPGESYHLFMKALFDQKFCGNQLSETRIIEFSWGNERIFNASHSVGDMSVNALHGMDRLRQEVARERLIFGADTVIGIVSHSQGTVVTLAALQTGMQVDNWILMGSPLNRDILLRSKENTHMALAANNVSGFVLNLWSREDDILRLMPGSIGRNGLPETIHPRIRNAEIDGVNHNASENPFRTDESYWWLGDWLLRPERWRLQPSSLVCDVLDGNR